MDMKLGARIVIKE